jgi:hypothetical protein
MDGLAYLPGEDKSGPTPLGRYLPPAPGEVATSFLAGHLVPGAWVLDPFGASPQVAAEIVHSGYRLLVAVNNPVLHFLFEIAALPPSPAELRAALAELAAARKGDERLETHLQSLYRTSCSECQRVLPAEAFVWDRDSGNLVSRIYHCPCGEGGEFPVTEEDIKLAASLAATDGLHRSRALERVASPDDPDRSHAEQALQCYLPRAVYSLITLVNKLDNLSLPSDRRRALLALLLFACDEGSSLWAHPADRPRPKQLTLPARFLEKNVWLALERGVEAWSGEDQPVPLTEWPNLPPESGGLCLFDGPIRDLAPQLKELAPGAVVTVLPRPNQAFWTLSALWAGWLWGREATAAFKHVVRRRRYDWNWHTAALYAALKHLSDQLPLNSPLFAILPEIEPSFLTAALLAAAGSGFDLSGLALRSRQDPAQVLWHRRAFVREEKESPEFDVESIRRDIQLTLQERGEPVPYLTAHAAGLSSMAMDHSLRWREEALNQIHAPILEALAFPGFVHHSESANPEIGLWSAVRQDDQIEPLPDRVEVAVVRYLQKNPGAALRELEAAINREFPGLQTPNLGLLRAVLNSYAAASDGRWSLRPEDDAAARRTDLETAAATLSTLGPRLGYAVEREETPQRMVRWQAEGRTDYTFFILASALAGKALRRQNVPSGQRLLVLPGGRAGLLAYKLERDPALKALAEGWRVVKFRQLRRLAELSRLTRERFEEELASDPIEVPEQMKLF